MFAWLPIATPIHGFNLPAIKLERFRGRFKLWLRNPSYRTTPVCIPPPLFQPCHVIL